MRSYEVITFAHVVGRYDEPNTPEAYDVAAKLYRKDEHAVEHGVPNIRVALNTGRQTEPLRNGLVWLVTSWQQLQDLLRGPGTRENSLARRCPYFR